MMLHAHFQVSLVINSINNWQIKNEFVERKKKRGKKFLLNMDDSKVRTAMEEKFIQQ